MAWVTPALAFWALIISTVGQAEYGPYRGPSVVPVILPGGFLADTKDVAAAKEYFLNALAKTAAEVKDESSAEFYNTRTYQVPQPSYQQSLGMQQHQAQPLPAAPAFQPQPQGYTQLQSQPQSTLLFSPQVAYRATPLYDSLNHDDGEYREELQYQYISSSPRPDPQVVPVILENGYIADTQEVNDAKANHFAAVAKAQEAVARAQAMAKTAGYSSPGYEIAAPAPPSQNKYRESYRLRFRRLYSPVSL